MAVLIVLIVIGAIVTVGVLFSMRGTKTGRDSPRHSFRAMLRGFFPKDTGELEKVTAFNDVASWTPVHQLSTDDRLPNGAQRIALGWPTDGRRKVLRDKTSYSDGETPVGIVCGGTGSWKTSTILAWAALMWGRYTDGSIANGGSPLVMLAPKTELMELSLKGRLTQGKVALWCPDGPSLELLPEVLRPYLAKWTPLCEVGKEGAFGGWSGAQAMAEAMCPSSDGAGGQVDFWSNTAARLLAAAFWTVVMRGSGGSLNDVYDVLTRPTIVRTTKEDGTEQVIELDPLKAMHAEIERRLVLPEGAPDTPANRKRVAGAHLAMRAIADLAISEAPMTNSGVVTTAATALSVVLREGTPDIAWDDPDCIDFDELLVNSAGSIFVTGSIGGMRAVRPLTSAFLGAVKRHMEHRAYQNGGLLTRRLLVIIDELPIICGAGEMFSEWCATARSSGVQLLYAMQDVATLDWLWGEDLRLRTINNTPDKLFFPAVADLKSLELAEALAGDHKVTTKSSSKASTSGRSSGVDGKSSGETSTTSESEEWPPRIHVAGRGGPCRGR
jgi:type IV secretory pathway TraG/TraD family ATPase VirD4